MNFESLAVDLGLVRRESDFAAASALPFPILIGDRLAWVREALKERGPDARPLGPNEGRVFLFSRKGRTASPASPAPTKPCSRPGGRSSCAGRISGRSGDGRPARPMNGSRRTSRPSWPRPASKPAARSSAKRSTNSPPPARRRRAQGPVVRSGSDRRSRRRGRSRLEPGQGEGPGSPVAPGGRATPGRAHGDPFLSRLRRPDLRAPIRRRAAPRPSSCRGPARPSAC
ncbi:MAG: hypothetical protein M0C28_00855 [Candidatus Moduliflexus flocculans]|nr:hypothetical protein [Candidatus Moduliflexus flocculans]